MLSWVCEVTDLPVGYLQKALDYIDKNLSRDITLYEISKEAGFSVPHFYRLFRRLTGGTVGAYINRRRLAAAARSLRESGKPILDIALESGFQSHDVFTRAFSREYGLSPGKYRRSAVPPPLQKTKEIDAPPCPDDRQMTFRLVHSEGFYVVGMECPAEIWDGDGSIGRLWSEFLERAEEIRHVSSPMTMYGICTCETSESGRFTYIAALGVDRVDDAPPGMAVRFIRRQRFFQASVPNVVGVSDAYTGTIGVAKSLGYEMDAYDNIEVYEDSFQDPEYNRFKLLIPIRGGEGEQGK